VTRQDLPQFRHPPVVEVALGVQFQPLQALATRHLAILAERWKHEFPNWEDQPIQPPVKEWFGVGQPAVALRFDLQALPPVRRAFFFDNERTELLQVQADRFVRNWRRTVQPYPRYEDNAGGAGSGGLRTRFRRDLEEFIEFVRDQRLGAFSPNQCEVTYVNHVPTSGERSAATLAELLQPWRGNFSDASLGIPESVETTLRFLITHAGKNVGRLHVQAIPVLDTESGDTLTRLTLTARGAPLGPGVDGILGFLDLGRRYVVQGFASVTTETMHQKWERIDGS
jgi:uncharacterized protein (TIGR04255 family)